MKKSKRISWWKKITPKQRDEIIQKRKQTCLEKYGAPSPAQSQKIKDKIIKTNLEKYGSICTLSSPKIQEKRNQTWKRKYGNKHPLQVEEIKEKRKQTCLEKYGVECSLQSQEIRDKGKQTCLEKYGVENPSQAEEIKKKKEETNLRKFKKPFAAQNKECMEKAKRTFLEKYGVENPSQNKNVREKVRISLMKKFYTKLFSSNRLQKLVEPLFTIDDYNGVSAYEKYPFRCKKCELVFGDYLDNGHIPKCPHCFPVENRFTVPHKIICEFLDQQNILYSTEKYISPYWADIFVEPNKIIEVYGDYWHGNPKIYKMGDTINFPRGGIVVDTIWQKDRKRIDFLSNKNNILILWEDEINHNFELTKNKILNFLG
jgi:hypothetical protein